VNEAIEDGTWQSVEIGESIERIKAKYPGVDPYHVEEMPCE
jgi:hypothetical protein